MTQSVTGLRAGRPEMLAGPRHTYSCEARGIDIRNGA